jgi:hypothetical protein
MILLRILSLAMLLVPLAATLAAWPWSYRQGENLTWTPWRREVAAAEGGRSPAAYVRAGAEVYSAAGGLEVSAFSVTAADPTWVRLHRDSPVFHRRVYRGAPRYPPVLSDDVRPVGGFALFSRHVEPSSPGAAPTYVAYSVIAPYWFLALALGVPAVWLNRRIIADRRRRRRLARGQCASCGYDLRANPSGRCPECGADAPPPPRTRGTG